MIGSDRLGETDHSHHCYVCQCLRENTIITLKWWIWGQIYMKFSIQMPDVPWRFRKSIASPMASKDQVLKVRIRSPKSAWRRTATTHHGVNGSGFGWTCHQNGIKMMKEDERRWRMVWICGMCFGCAEDLFIWFKLQILQLVAGNGDWKSMFPGPREQLPLLCRRRKEVTHWSEFSGFLVSNQPRLSSDYVICKDFESPIVYIPNDVWYNDMILQYNMIWQWSRGNGMDLDINSWQAFGVVPEDGRWTWCFCCRIWQMFKAFSPWHTCQLWSCILLRLLIGVIWLKLCVILTVHIWRVFKSSGSLSLSWLPSNHCVDVCFPFVLEASRS